MIAAQRTDFVYLPSQTWVSTNVKLAYILENGDGTGSSHDESVISADQEIHTNDQVQHGSDAGQPGCSQSDPLHSSNTPDTRTSLSYVLSSPSTSMRASPWTYSNTTITDYRTPDARSESSRCTGVSSTLAPSLSHREALLMQYFIRVISPWLDVLQDVPRFAQEVPMRATKSPMLLFSILAASSRHQALRDSDWQEASDYHSKCLILVIQALSQPEHCHDNTLIVTMVCLRLYELFNQQPFSALHLDGFASLLTAIPNFLQSGGLAEASAWLALRHDLFMAMMTKRAPNISLNAYEHSNVFLRRPNPSADAYAIILIWAKILRRLYLTESDALPDTWPLLDKAVADWYVAKKIEPLFHQDPNVDPDQPFPIISMTTAQHGTV
ncbi:hypothetical protein QM012_005045 [Aureobasidium pullulans]|uniref:Transcription factor domain-containing protein n=1 Tax=Aureobasidium pullulans TaxID=5580 RepID=A0ABR0T6C4_AURPU